MLRRKAPSRCFSLPSVARLSGNCLTRGFASPPYDGFALIEKRPYCQLTKLAGFVLSAQSMNIHNASDLFGKRAKTFMRQIQGGTNKTLRSGVKRSDRSIRRSTSQNLHQREIINRKKPWTAVGLLMNGGEEERGRENLFLSSYSLPNIALPYVGLRPVLRKYSPTVRLHWFDVT